MRKIFLIFLMLMGASAPLRPATIDIDNLKALPDFEFLLFDSKKKLVPTKLSAIIRTNKILVIDFWATWCGPCRKSIPELIALQNEYKERGVAIYGLSIEDPAALNRVRRKQKNTAAVWQMADEFTVNYHVGFAPPEMFTTFDRTGIVPQTFIFGRDGVLIKQIRGYSSERVPKIWRESIATALQQDEQR